MKMGVVLLVTCCIVLFGSYGRAWCFEWETQPDPVLYSCVGSKVTFPWRFKVADSEVIRDIRWFFDGVFDSTMVGTQTYGFFFPTPPYSQRVRQLTNGGLVLSDVTMADSGNYSVEVTVEGQGSTQSQRHTVLLQVGDGLMTEGGRLTASQDPVALWDNSIQQWVIRLTCGRFTFQGQPPVHVVWTTPRMETVVSSGYDKGLFYLTLPSPVTGGNYSCHIPQHLLPDVCISNSNHDNHVVTSRVLVDGVQARLSVLEAAMRTLKSEHTSLRQECHDNLTNYINWPCFLPNHEVLDDVRRAVTNGEGKLCDKSLTPGWYRFTLNGSNAVIPTYCVPVRFCGTERPVWLDLQGLELPEAGQKIDARLCTITPHTYKGDYILKLGRCCALPSPITVYNCGAFFVYKLKPTRSCNSAFCAQKMDS